MVEAMGAEEL